MKFTAVLLKDGTTRTVEFDYGYDAVSLLETHVASSIAREGETLVGVSRVREAAA